ncbi:hypothetical protein FOL47_010701 [Perkinsus chesapeaki]|uniref:Integrase catalytic domain-containing protein n=1 Tax=Perkinsus chesapeaki TaxID=330153 RepID=A0A7J6L0L8_PERCH|nr:hypothetical protein FOL47_010701 [Perkinsus chesapeaki]
MRDDVRHVISQCCNTVRERNKAVTPKLSAPSPRRLSHKRWWCVAVDAFNVEGVPILSIIDEFSRFALVRLLAVEKADDAYEGLVGCFECPLLGYPAYVRSDREIFVSLRERLLTGGVVLILTSGYRPTANAVVERLHPGCNILLYA